MDLHSLLGRASTMMSGKRNDDSMADRLNYRYTVGILVVFAIINMNRLYTNQIKCWVPAFFTPNYDDYVRSVCFVQNTYFVNHTSKVPKSMDVKKESEILYYQWIPFLLLVKAFFFYLPRISWNTISSKSGVQLSDLVESSFDYKLPMTDSAHRQMCLNYVIDTIDQYCDDHRRQNDARAHLNLVQRSMATGCCITGRFLGNYLVVLYMTTKLMYIGVSLFQIFFLSTMLGSNFLWYGLQVIDRLFRGVSLDTETRLFPKTTLCDFTVREFGHPKLAHEYTVPCVLPLNLFNQQMFTFLYFWYALVISLNIADLCLWLYAFSPYNRRAFVRRRLISKKYPLTNESKQRERINSFADDYLEADGFFILTLIKENTSDFVASEIVHRLYTKKFLNKYFSEPKYDAIDIKQDDNDDSESKTKRRHHLCSMIC